MGDESYRWGKLECKSGQVFGFWKDLVLCVLALYAAMLST
jgi:hypothetical protein